MMLDEDLDYPRDIYERRDGRDQPLRVEIVDPWAYPRYNDPETRFALNLDCWIAIFMILAVVYHVLFD